jgi:hypothetical protein
MKSRRGISEIVSVFVIIAVMISGLGLYTTLSQQRILGDAQSVNDVLNLSEEQLVEMIDHIGMIKNGTTVQVFVHNYGLKNITVSDVYVNGTKEMGGINPVYVKSLQDVNLDKTIPNEMTSQIILNFTGDPDTPKHIDRIILRTSSYKLIEIKNNTSN